MSTNQPPIKFEIETVPSANGVYSTYANNFVLQWSGHDVRIRFSELVNVRESPDHSTRTLTVEERAAVTLSWNQAKGLRDNLSELIDKYEKLNGSIKTPTVP